MSDALDDLRAELQPVEPSRTFERDTLARVERERARTAKRAWMFMAPLAAAAVIVVAVVSMRPSSSPRSSGGVGDQAAPARRSLGAGGLPAPVIVSPGGGVVDHSALPAPAIRMSRAARRAEPVADTWTIPKNAHADQAIAVRRLMVLIRAGRAIVPAGTAAANDDAAVQPGGGLAPVELKPIVITPLPTGQGGGSEK